MTTYREVEGTPLRLVDCPENVYVSVTGVLRHMCPYKDEADVGTVTLGWHTSGYTVELHSLRDYLDTFTDSPVSHEAITTLIAETLEALPGIQDIHVATKFPTAGFAVDVAASLWP